MEKLTTQEKAWISQLESNNPAATITAIREIRQHGNLKMLPRLFKLLKSSTNEIICESIIMLTGEIKVQEAASLIVDALENTDMGNHFTPMVAACWQSGLDFSEHIPAFIKIFLNGDYQTSIEAFSVIEESFMNAEAGRQKKCIKMLENAEKDVPEDKYPLFRELVKVVSGRQDGS